MVPNIMGRQYLMLPCGKYATFKTCLIGNKKIEFDENWNQYSIDYAQELRADSDFLQLKNFYFKERANFNNYRLL